MYGVYCCSCVLSVKRIRSGKFTLHVLLAFANILFLTPLPLEDIFVDMRRST